MENISRCRASQIPPKQEGKVVLNERFSCFGYSLQGSSHIKNDVPCQDYNGFKCVEGCDIMVAAISDGVGSCPLSHWGSYITVETAIQFTVDQIQQINGRKKFRITDHQDALPVILKNAFRKALDTVEDFAEKEQRPVAAFLSTLTLAVYDGTVLCCQHIGDDGVVAQFMNGSVEMVTNRVKGEEASSVYPLQSGESLWEYSISGLDARGAVVAFTMVTDGILDKFVFEDQIYQQTGSCCGGVFYPFMKPMVYNCYESDCNFKDEAHKMQYYLDVMNTDGYRRQVTDDLTLVSVVNPALVKKGNVPDFDKYAFQTASKMIRERQNQALYSPKPSSDSIHSKSSPRSSSTQRSESGKAGSNRENDSRDAGSINRESAREPFPSYSRTSSNTKPDASFDCQQDEETRVRSYTQPTRRKKTLMEQLLQEKLLAILLSLTLVLGVLIGILCSFLVFHNAKKDSTGEESGATSSSVVSEPEQTPADSNIPTVQFEIINKENGDTSYKINKEDKKSWDEFNPDDLNDGDSITIYAKPYKDKSVDFAKSGIWIDDIPTDESNFKKKITKKVGYTFKYEKQKTYRVVIEYSDDSLNDTTEASNVITVELKLENGKNGITQYAINNGDKQELTESITLELSVGDSITLYASANEGQIIDSDMSGVWVDNVMEESIDFVDTIQSDEGYSITCEAGKTYSIDISYCDSEEALRSVTVVHG